MRKTIINAAAALAVVAGLAVAAVAPWWVVWLVAFPVIYAGALVLISCNTRNLEQL